MAADLSDDEIDRLLSEAESRLASKASHKDASTPKESCAQISIAAGTDNVTSSEENDEPRKQKQPELLSVRVPQLAAKKNKVGRTFSRSPTVSSSLSYDDNIFSSYDAATRPVMGAGPAKT